MPDLARTLRRLVARITGAGRGAAPSESHIVTALDGASAIALTEAAISEAAGLGAHPTPGDDDGGDHAFADRLLAHRENLLGRALSGVDAADARGAVATAVGLSLSGLRATAFAGASDLGATHDQLILAAGRHAPLVVHLGCRASAGPGIATGSGHDAYHAAAGTGLIQLMAGNVQEAVDLSMVARRVAEQALVPVLVAADWDETLRSVQDVSLPTAELVARYLGRPGDAIDAPTPAQALLFGERRRRVPRWFDLARPTLSGATYGRDSFGVAAAAARPFFYDHVAAILARAIDELVALTGRDIGLVREHRTQGADTLVVAQGAAVELAIAVADRARGVGVVGVRALRPLAGERLAELIGRARKVVVLERTDAPLAGSPPLTRELAALELERRPAMISALYGLGGLPVTAASVRAAIDADRSPIYLGARLTPAPSRLPKRQVLVGQLNRDYPELAALDGGEMAVDLGDTETLIADVHGTASAGRIAGTALVQVAGGHLRAVSDDTRLRLGWHQGSVPVIAPDVAADVALMTDARANLARAAARGLRAGGAVVIDHADPATLADQLGASGIAALRERDARVYLSCAADDESDEDRAQRLAGALLAALSRGRELGLSARKLSAHGDALGTGFDGLDAAELGTSERPAPLRVSSPAVVAHLRARDERDEQAAGNLPRFWNQVGVLYEDPDRVARELTADPYLASGTVPLLSAALRGPRDDTDMLPRFEAGACTGCGRCWAACPDGAIGATALDVGALVDHGAKLAVRAGADTAALRPMIGKLTPMVHGTLRGADRAPATAAELVAHLCRPAIEDAPLPEARKQPMLSALDAAGAALGALPLARTAPLFDDPERARAGDGALLTLAIDPAACKGCGACVSVCADDALVAVAADDQARRDAAEGWSRWDALPDTPGPVIARARQHDTLGDLAGLLLSRHCALAMAGADDTEPGSGARLALRLTLAAGELALQQDVTRQLDDLRAARKQVADALESTLHRGLPTGDLAALAERLDNVASSAADLSALTGGDGAVDVARTRRLVGAARDLDELGEALAVGAFGQGRARLGLVVAADPLLEGIASFPYNPFAVPTLVDASGEAAALARGAVEGQLRAAAEHIATVRRARVAATDPGRAPLLDAELARLSWPELSADERRFCPPMVVVGGSASFTDRALARLVDGDLPIVVLLLSGGARGERNALGVLAFGLSNPGLFVAQTSIGAPAHLGRSLAAAFAHRGPALVHVHAPSPRTGGFAPAELIARAEAAIASRQVPLFVFDPAAPGVFGTHLSLDGNPDLDQGADDDLPRREWRVLCELAGVETPFTERVRAEAADAVRAAHAAELAAVRSGHAAELASVRAELRAEAARQVRDRLLDLAGYGQAGSPQEPA